MASAPTFEELFAGCERSAVHLEMRDGYMRSDPAFIVWRAGHRLTDATLPPEYAQWRATVAAAVARGVGVRRVRIVSEPLSEYIRFEHELTFHNIRAGEQVRWLPRKQASDLALPGNDFWLFDDQLVVFNHFGGNDEFLENERRDDSDTVSLCRRAFESVWARAKPHETYEPVVASVGASL